MQTHTICPMITCENLSAVKEFYTSYLGFQSTFESEGHLCLRNQGRRPVELMFQLPGEGEELFNGQGVVFCLEVSQVDEEYQRLQQCGLPFATELKDNPWGDRSFILRDPAGVQVYVYTPTEMSAEYQQYVKE